MLKEYPWFVEIMRNGKTYHYCSMETEEQAKTEAERLNKIYPENSYTVRYCTI